MKINWTVRFKNKTFWLTMIPTLMILIQVVADLFGFQLDLSDLGNKLIAVANAVFAVLAVFGVTLDHTTAGFGDSNRALGYSVPRNDK